MKVLPFLSILTLFLLCANSFSENKNSVTMRMTKALIEGNQMPQFNAFTSFSSIKEFLLGIEQGESLISSVYEKTEQERVGSEEFNLLIRAMNAFHRRRGIDVELPEDPLERVELFNNSLPNSREAAIFQTLLDLERNNSVITYSALSKIISTLTHDQVIFSFYSVGSGDSKNSRDALSQVQTLLNNSNWSYLSEEFRKIANQVESMLNSKDYKLIRNEYQESVLTFFKARRELGEEAFREKMNAAQMDSWYRLTFLFYEKLREKYPPAVSYALTSIFLRHDEGMSYSEYFLEKRKDDFGVKDKVVLEISKDQKKFEREVTKMWLLRNLDIDFHTQQYAFEMIDDRLPEVSNSQKRKIVNDAFKQIKQGQAGKGPVRIINRSRYGSTIEIFSELGKGLTRLL